MVELIFKITADNNQAVKAMRELRETYASGLKSIQSTFQSFGSSMQSVGTKLTAAVTLPIVALGAASIKSALQLDSLRNKLIAVEGSAEAAERRIAKLRDLAQSSVGVTTSTAGAAYAQLATIGGITEKTIERQIKAMGRLNAAFEIEDQSGFFRNVTQIFQQGFERSDIKEALGRVPIFEQLLESAFGTKEGAKLKALKESGKLTLEAFLAGLAEAVESDARLANIGESLGVRLQKSVERVSFALNSLGKAILDVVEPYITPLVQAIEGLGNAFAALPAGAQLGVVAFGALAAAAGPLLVAGGALVSALGTVAGALAAVSAPMVAVVAGVGALVAGFAAAGAGIFAAWQSNLGGVRDFTNEVWAEITKAFDEALAFVKELWARYGDDITHAAEAAWGVIKGVVVSVSTEVVNYAREKFGELVAWFKENWPLIKESVVTVLDGVRAAVKGALKIISDFWKENGTEITATVKLTWSIIKGVFDTFMPLIGGAVKAGMQIINGDWSDAWDTFKKTGDSVGDKMRDLGKLILAKLLLIGFEMHKAGRDLGAKLVDGIVGGIKEGVARTVAAARELALAPITISKSILGIQSPSRVFYEIGRNIVRGLLEAIREGNAAVQSAFAALVTPPTLRGIKHTPAQAARSAGLSAAEGETLAGEARAAAERDFEQWKISDAEFVRRLKEAETRAHNAQLARVASERAEASATTKNRADLALKLEELRQRDEELKRAHHARMSEIDAAARGRERAAALSHQRALDELAEARGQREIARLEQEADAGLILRSEAERRIQEIRDAALGREVAALEKEREARRANLNEQQRITDEIIALNDRRAASAEAAMRRIVDASIRETTPTAPPLPGIPGVPKIPTGPIVTGTDEEIFGDLGTPPPAPPAPDFSIWHDAFELLKQKGMESFNGLAQGMGSMIQNFLTAGQAGAQSFASLAKAITASLAAQALVEAAMQVAHAFKEFALASASAAVFDVRGAVLHTAAAHAHLKAAAAFGLVGGVAAAAAVAIPGGGKGGAGASGDSQDDEGDGRDDFTRDSRFTYNAETGSRRDGPSGGIFQYLEAQAREQQRHNEQNTRLILTAMERTASALSTLETASPEDVVQRGHERNPHATMERFVESFRMHPTRFADAVLKESGF